MSFDHFTPSTTADRKRHDAADRHQALAHLRGQIALATDRDQDLGISLGLTVALALGLEDVVADLVDLGAAALQNVGAAVDHRVQQLHQHHLAGDRRGTGTGELGLDQAEGLRQVVAHRHQAVVAQDEGHWRGPGHVGIGVAHQRRGHVARAVLHIEPARNLDLLHVFAGRDGDTREPLHGLILGRARIDEVDPDRVLRYRRKILDDSLLEGELGGNKHRKHQTLQRSCGRRTALSAILTGSR